jgi:hypothetical protein
LTFYVCESNYVCVLCSISIKEYLPEYGHNSWPKHVAGYAVCNTINVNRYALVGRTSVRVAMSANRVLCWIFCHGRFEMTGSYRELRRGGFVKGVGRDGG